LGDQTSFRAKGLRGTTCNRNFTAVLGDRTSSPDNLQIAILPQFLAIKPHFVRNSCAGQLANRNFTSAFGDRTSFRAKRLRTCRLVGTAPRLQERNRKEGESKRAREQEGKRECEDVKM